MKKYRGRKSRDTAPLIRTKQKNSADAFLLPLTTFTSHEHYTTAFNIKQVIFITFKETMSRDFLPSFMILTHRDSTAYSFQYG